MVDASPQTLRFPSFSESENGEALIVEASRLSAALSRLCAHHGVGEDGTGTLLRTMASGAAGGGTHEVANRALTLSS
jgi:hypothetical protein